MKTVKHIISLLLLMLATTLSAQVVEFHVYQGYVSKYYMTNYDSIVYVPAQDWSISANVDSYYEDSQLLDVHALITVTVGPNAEIARAGFSNTRDASELDIELKAGTTQTIDVVVPDSHKACTFVLYTKNKYHEYSDYYTSITVDYGNRDWEDIGTALYREDLLTTFFGVDNLIYEVPIQKNKTKEGYYRIVNPYGKAYPYNGYGDYDPDTVCYLTINATDPDWVYVEESPTAMDWGYGVFSMQSYISFYVSNGNYTVEDLKALRPQWFGTLKDGIITMPAGTMLISMANYNSGGWYTSNLNGLFGVALPGERFKDYSVSVSYSGIYTEADGNAFAVGNLTLGEDVKTVKAVVVSSSLDAAAVADSVAAGTLSGIDVTAGRIEVPIPRDLEGKLQIVAVVIDENEVKGVGSDTFTYYINGIGPWKSIGIGVYVDDFVVPLFTEEVGPYACEVEIQESTVTPGLYRLVDAYAPIAAAFGMPGGHENIEIHAENPNGVYILEQPIGMDFGYGDMSIVTVGGDYVGYYGDFDFVYENAPQLFGTLEDGVITFPSLLDDQNGNYQGFLTMGGNYYYGGLNGSIKIYLPEAIQSNSKIKAKAESLKDSTVKLECRLDAAKKVSVKRPVLKTILKKPKEVKVFKYKRQVAPTAEAFIN